MKLSPSLFRALPLAAAMAFAFAPHAQAQSLVELYDAARGYDASYIAAKSLYEANLAKANQTLGGVLPNIALSASASRTYFNYRPDAPCLQPSSRLSVTTAPDRLPSP